MKKTTKKTLKGFVVGVIITTMFISTPVGAQVKNAIGVMFNIDVMFNAVNIKTNGEAQDIDNFLYEGTTYVPLRVISKIFDKEVTWDGPNKTVNIYNKEVSQGKVYDRISEYMKAESIATYSPYYELLDFQISNYKEMEVDGNVEATFFYKIIKKNFDKDPDTIGYIKELKESENKHYQQMYDEYLEPQVSNFDLKVIIDKNDKITLYSNMYDAGLGWVEIKMTDCITEGETTDTWGIKLSAKYITSTGMTLECNQLDGEPTGDLQTGSYYIIETYNGSGWLPVDYKDNEMEVAWTDEAWIIPMNDTVEWKVDWEWLYGNLPNGKYRIGKEIMDFRDTGDYDEKTYYANFKINGSIEILDNQAPDIIEVSFTNLSGEDLLKDGWFTVGEDNKLKINIKVKGNCTSVDMFIKPTGTDTYTSQKMVDSLVGGPGENQFEYIWDVPEGTMSHFWIIAYNGDIGQRSKPFNIYNDY